MCINYVFIISERTCHITQMAFLAEEEEFKSYVLPKLPVSKEAQKAAKMENCTITTKKKTHFPFLQLWTAYWLFLEQFGKKLILFGHNIQSFDCPVLMHALQACNKVSEFTEAVDGFVDTLKLFNFVKPGLSSYRQENLCECLSGIVYTAHNAIGDVSALKTLVQSYFTSIKLDKPDIQRCSVTVQSVIASYLYSFQIRLNLPSLQPLVARKITSQGIARKIAGSGLQYTHLQTAFNHNQNGISNLCVGNNVKAQCGLQNPKKIISSLNNQLAQCNESWNFYWEIVFIISLS